MDFGAARAVADAVLFEGYVLYPYRASATKNHMRWQFGVLAPSGAGEDETCFAQTECLVDTGTQPDTARTELAVAVRFMQASTRMSDPPWDEGVVREAEASAMLNGDQVRRRTPFSIPGGTSTPDGVARTWRQLDGVIEIDARRLPGPYALHKVGVRVTNHTRWDGSEHGREDMLRSSLIAAHTLLAVRGGAFVSLLEPPQWARAAAEECRNRHTWPVLTGEPGGHAMLLSSPIILYDYPQIAPESPTDLCDGTEIDEILTLRTMTLTDAEKREARATDPKAAAIVDAVDALPQQMLDKLHGAVRYLREVSGTGPSATPAGPPAASDPPWWDPGVDASVSPETDAVEVRGGTARKGSRVRLRPGNRRTDAQDMFLDGRTARVEAVFFDVDEGSHLAVTLEDDPAADVQQWVGRYRYFTPDEVELLEAGA